MSIFLAKLLDEKEAAGIIVDNPAMLASQRVHISRRRQLKVPRKLTTEEMLAKFEISDPNLGRTRWESRPALLLSPNNRKVLR
jgi:hypothetical protein